MPPAPAASRSGRAPPGIVGRWTGRLDCLAGPGDGDGAPEARGFGRDAPGRIVPVVEREVERPPVHGNEQPAAQSLVRPDQLLRKDVDRGPRPAVRAGAHPARAERAVLLADRADPVEVSRVAAVEDPMPGTGQDPGAPERPVAVAETAPRK